MEELNGQINIRYIFFVEIDIGRIPSDLINIFILRSKKNMIDGGAKKMAGCQNEGNFCKERSPGVVVTNLKFN